MFKFLTSKKGFTLVELMIVLALLGLGSVAFINFFNVAMKSFNKSEERYIKQEAVKEVAAILQTGSASVAAAQTADIFSTNEVVPCGKQTDDSYSYLFATESKDENGVSQGYFIYIQNRGVQRKNAMKLSATPIYVNITQQGGTRPKLDANGNNVNYYELYNGVTIRLAALEDDYDYTSGVAPTGDDIYYSLDVAYHFPNMATSEDFSLVSHISKDEYSTANKYIQVEDTETGGYQTGTGSVVEATHCGPNTGLECPTNGNCQADHCGNNSGKCDESNCSCPNKNGVVLRVYCDSIISPDNTESAISAPSMCFVATASYGLDSGEVGQLCEFRDQTLMNSELGKAFVKAYYKISPPIADAIRESEPLKAVVRTTLKPLIIVAEYANNEEIRTTGAVSIAIFMICGIASSAIAVKMNQDKKRNRDNSR